VDLELVGEADPLLFFRYFFSLRAAGSDSVGRSRRASAVVAGGALSAAVGVAADRIGIAWSARPSY